MPLDLRITPGNASPIFKQIVDQVRLAIARGKLPEGQQLPSVRALAEQVLVNPNTIAKAYGELVREGAVESQQGRGYFIARPRQIYTKVERQRRIEPLLDAIVHEGVALGFSPAELAEALHERYQRLGISGSQVSKT